MKNPLKITTTLVLFSFFVIVTSILTAGLIVRERLNDAKNYKDAIEKTATDSGQTTQQSPLTSSTIANHNSPSDCWINIDQTVYNVTSFLVNHPGGAAVISPFCGKDASQAFNTKGKNPPKKHSQTGIDLLKTFKIGVIGQAIILPDTSNSQQVSSLTSAEPVTPTKTIGTSPQTGTTTLSIATVASHSTASDCWITINGNAYNVTSFLVNHAGGSEVITPYCGKDATQAFNTKGKSPGQSHSAYAQSLLAQYLIGAIGSSVNTNTSGLSVIPNTPLPTATNKPQIVPTSSSASQPTTQTLTTAEVANHSSASNCWIVISQKVYNVTNFLVSHPGGVGTITLYCGKEATQAFQSKGGKGSNHSQSAYSMLNQYLLGTVGLTVNTNPTPTTNGGSTANPSATTASQNTTPQGVPASVSSKYPNASYTEVNVEDDGRTEIKLNYQGQCRSIKTNNAGQITNDTHC